MQEVKIKIENIELNGLLVVPKNAKAIILFAHGSGSSRFSPRNQFVSKTLNKNGFATLLIDLLTLDEEAIDDKTGELRFDIEFLARRLISITNWLKLNYNYLKIGYFGASTGAAAALIASSQNKVPFAIVSRGGRPDLALGFMKNVVSPTLLIVGGNDFEVIEMNKKAFVKLKTKKKLEIVSGASHLFEEEGALEKVSSLATNWFKDNLK